MRETKIRFGRRAWDLIQEEAEHDDVSASQYVREAALARVLYARARRGDLEAGEAFDRIIRQLREE